ncbi:MAG: FtsX-like permease family protein [Clostridiales bacterium]|nr:FtsX-like permease family protein [Clostridiales bacterium]
MTKTLYLHLAWGNLRKNRGSYLPFLLACMLLIFTVYSFASIALNQGLTQLPGATAFAFMLILGLVVVSIFAAIFLFYANSFLIKRRKKELGLYAVLGMEKRHITKVLRWEMNLCYLASMFLGLGLGLLLNRLLYLLVGQILSVPLPLDTSPNLKALGGTALLFAGLYFLLKTYNSFQVRSVNPMALVHGSQVGEREPSSRWPFAVIGLVCLIGGYVLAQWVRDPMSAIALFFIAVILVIIGTYCLFMAGSLTILKLLKNNPRFFYKPKHFITVSSMLYRMKQNAAGLASIAILCTMAMVTVGTTVALYNGTEKIVNTSYPYDLAVYSSDASSMEEIREAAQSAAQESGMILHDLMTYESRQTTLGFQDGKLIFPPHVSSMGLNEYANTFDACLLTQDTFAQLQGADFTLPKGSVGWWSQDFQAPAALEIGEIPTTLLPLPEPTFQVSMRILGSNNLVYLVLPDEAAIESLLQALGEDPEGKPQRTYTLQMNLEGDLPEQEAFVELLESRVQTESIERIKLKASQRADIQSLYGGFLFVGIFLGFLFMMATALIIYFKQVSEGYQDHDRFIILQKVGMSHREVKATVHAQILIVFFLPLVVALCHVLGSLHMVTLMLKALSLSDAAYVALNTFLTAAGIAVLYTAVYLRTARTYYKMVRF